MMYLLSTNDVFKLSPSARAEIHALTGLKMSGGEGDDLDGSPYDSADYEGIDMDQVAELTERQVQVWMERASDWTKSGLRVIAERGPVIRARMLSEVVGSERLSHFQSRTTVRTRTVTGKKDVYLLSWDDWTQVDDGEGRYAVSSATYESLRRYFRLDQPQQ